MFHREHEHFPVTDLSSLRRSHDHIDRLFNQVIRHYDFHFHFRQKIHRVFASPVNFGMPFLPAETFDLSNGHSFDAELCERFFDLFELEWFYDGLQFFHVAVTLASRGALQPGRNASQSDADGSKANRSTRSHSNAAV